MRGLVTAASPIDGMIDSAMADSFAVQRRRESRRQEWAEQIKLAEMLDKYLNPADTFWTSLENKPISTAARLMVTVTSRLLAGSAVEDETGFCTD